MYEVSWILNGQSFSERCSTFQSALFCYLSKCGTFPNVDVVLKRVYA